MSDMLLIRRFFAYRRVQNSLAVIVMAISIALAVSVLLLSSGLHNALVQATEPFPILMGAKGSPNQLVLNSVFLQDEPGGTISYGEVESLRANPKVKAAIPLGFGDNYRGYRIIGTESGLFEMDKGIGKKRQTWLHVAEGRPFQAPYEAVIGAEAARKAKLKIGDTFASIHGVVQNEQGRAHDAHKFTVVGILEPLHSPYDSAILTDMESIWQAHGHHAGKEVSAVIIQPSGYAEAMQLALQYNKDERVQIVFPAKIIVRIFSIMGNVEQMMRFFSYGVIMIALLIITCSLYWFIINNRREQGIMRALGASDRAVARLNFKMGMFLVCCGVILGVALGHGIFALLSSVLQEKTAMYMTAGLLPEEGILIILLLLCGMACSWLASRLSGTANIADSL